MRQSQILDLTVVTFYTETVGDIYIRGDVEDTTTIVTDVVKHFFGENVKLEVDNLLFLLNTFKQPLPKIVAVSCEGAHMSALSTSYSHKRKCLHKQEHVI